MPEWVEDAARRYLNNPERVAVDEGRMDDTSIDHVAVDIANNNKHDVLRDLLDRRGDGSTIVFGRTKHGVRKLAHRLERDGYPVGALQGNLSQNARDRVMSNFRSGAIDILVATNVAARGLDIADVNLVINVDLPESSDLLTHRIGRTGRMDREGMAITLLGSGDGEKWRKLKRDLPISVIGASWDDAAKLIRPDGSRYDTVKWCSNSDRAESSSSRSLPVARSRNVEKEQRQPHDVPGSLLLLWRDGYGALPARPEPPGLLFGLLQSSPQTQRIATFRGPS